MSRVNVVFFIKQVLNLNCKCLTEFTRVKNHRPDPLLTILANIRFVCRTENYTTSIRYDLYLFKSTDHKEKNIF